MNVIIGSQCLSGVVSVTSDHVFGAMGSALLDIHGFHEYLWISIDTHGPPSKFLQYARYPWIRMVVHGYPWIFIGIRYIHGYQSIQKRYPWQCICIDSQQRVGASPCIIQVQEPWGGPRVQAAHIPRISRAYLPRQNRAQAPDCRPPPQIEGGLPPTGMSMDSNGYPWNCLMHGYSWISMDVEVDAWIFRSFQ